MTTAAEVIAGTAAWSWDTGPSLPWLRTLPAESVNCVVTSPPYYGLRDYGTAKWEGGDPTCRHRSPTMRVGRNEDRPLTPGSVATNGRQLILAAKAGVCGLCGATRTDEQLGLEDTPDLFIARLVDLFDEVRRVLTADGTLWVNIGDSYANDASTKGAPGPRLEGRANVKSPQKGWRSGGLKKKDRIGIPHMLAFALRAAGWWWRDEIIWHKPNPMPKSVRDRTTDAHEFLFMFTKSATYFYDFAAAQERAVWAGKPRGASHNRYQRGADNLNGKDYETRNMRSVWKISPDRRRFAGVKHFAMMPVELARRAVAVGSPVGGVVLDPFAGMGTTLAAALELNRRGVGNDLNPEYAEPARRRLIGITPNLIGA